MFGELSTPFFYYYSHSAVSYLYVLCPAARREECGAVDRSRGHPVPPLLLGLRCLELWHRHVGGHVLRRETLLGYGQPGCKWKERREREINLSTLSPPHIPPLFIFHVNICTLPASLSLSPPSASLYQWTLYPCPARILLKESQEATVPLKAFAGPKSPLFKSASAPWPILFSRKDVLTPFQWPPPVPHPAILLLKVLKIPLEKFRLLSGNVKRSLFEGWRDLSVD